MKDTQKAVASFREGLNCSQAILSTYGPALGLEPDLAMSVAAPFGGGMGHMGLTCGAITGALMIIGLHCNKPGRSVEQVKEKSYALARGLFKKFEARHGSTQCKALIGQNIDTPDGMEAARQRGVFDTVCPDLVRSAAEIVEELLS